MIYKDKQADEQAILQIATQMCAAARTAPKAHGKDTIHTLILTENDKNTLANKMDIIGKNLMGDKSNTWYGRDAANVRASSAVVLIGVENSFRGVPNCEMCGYKNCDQCKKAGGRCAFAMIDLGIAVSSAVNVASLSHIDNRIMFSIGKAVSDLDYIPNCIWLGIPLSVSGKNIFYDRGVFHD